MLDVARSKPGHLGLGLLLPVVAALALLALFPARSHKSIENSHAGLPPARAVKRGKSIGDKPDDAADLVLMRLPFAKVSAPLYTPDPDELTVLFQPPAIARAAAISANPRQLREMVDHEVTAYASANDLTTLKKAATLIQIAALLGYAPAREILVRNYPGSEAVRAVVDGSDIVAYSIDLFATRAISEATFKSLFPGARAIFRSR